MIIGVPKEIKNNENRVAISPEGGYELIRNGHTVLVEQNAGFGSGFTDQEYEAVGCQIIPDAKSLYFKSEMIVKVKEPLQSEYEYIRPHQVVFTYFHFAASSELTLAMRESHAVCIAYETVIGPRGGLPLLTPMSQVAGRLSVQVGTQYLMRPNGGVGILPGGVPGTEPAQAMILGGGVVGTEAAKMAAGLGMRVLLFDLNLGRIQTLTEILPANVTVLYSSAKAIEQNLAMTDLVIGAVLVPGGKAPHLITQAMLAQMKKGSVIVDVAVDQGGCIETSKPTTHDHPVYEVDGVLHYGVANMPGAVPVTSTRALTNATLPYIKKLADQGWMYAVTNDQGLKAGVNIVEGNIVNAEVAAVFDLDYNNLDELLNQTGTQH